MINTPEQIRTAIERGNFVEARALALRALVKSQDEETRARIAHNLALATHRAGDSREALSIIDANASSFERAPRIVRANVANERGIILYKLGRVLEARSEYERAVRLYEDDEHRAAALNNLALCHMRGGRYREAHARAAESRRTWQRGSNRARVAQAFDTLAQILLAERRFKDAARAILRARALLLGTDCPSRLRSIEETRAAIQRAAQFAARRGLFIAKPTRASRRTVDAQRTRAP
jgi:tetratricopeptide (TPR) repeat protein